MAFSGVEYLTNCEGSVAAASSGTHILSWGYGPGGAWSDRGTGTFSILDLSTNTAKAYGGLWTNATTSCVTYHGSKFYTTGSYSDWAVYTIASVTTGGVVTAGAFFFDVGQYSPIVGCGDFVYRAGLRLTISTNTLTSAGVPASTVWGSANGRLFHVSGVTLTEINPSTMATLATWTLPKSPIVSRATVVGDVLWWGTGDAAEVVVGFDTDADTVMPSIASSPPGIPSRHGAWEAHSDGYLYSVANNFNSVVVYDPLTGRWASDTPVSSRIRRFCVVSASGKLWIPSSLPGSW